MKIKIGGEWQEVKETHDYSYLSMIDLEDGSDWYVARDSEEAGKAARQHWLEMAENDPKEFACIVGEETLIGWALGQSAGHAGCSSLEEWLDLVETVPEEEFGSYDGGEVEVEDCDSELKEDLGFKPGVAYRHN